MSTTPLPTRSAKELFRIVSASSWSPRPRAMEQSGAPPMPKSCVNAEMMLMMGKVRPMPVSASVEASGRWPMYMRSTTL